MKINIGDILRIGSYEIIVVGFNYGNYISSKVLIEHFCCNHETVVYNYITELDEEHIIEKFILDNILYYILDGKDIMKDELQIGVNEYADISEKNKIGNISREEVKKLLIKKKLLNCFYFDITQLVDYDFLYKYAKEYKNRNYKESDVKFVLDKERNIFNTLLEKKPFNLNESNSNLNKIEWNRNIDVITFSKRYMYLYQVRPTFKKGDICIYLGKALLSNKDECFKLYLKHYAVPKFIVDVSNNKLKGEKGIII